MDELLSIVSTLESDIERCLESLCDRLQVAVEAVGTHVVLTITGLNRSPDCLRDLAVYCVGQITKAVQVNLEIRSDLLGLDNEDAREQLIRDVCSVIGEDHDALTNEQKEDERDPWLVEALSHLFVHLSTRNPHFLPVGQLICLMPMHGHVKEPGLDLVAAYVNVDVGLGIGESKAWENNPSGGLRSAAGKFSDVDLGSYDSDLRAAVGLMRYAMPPIYQNRITGAFWREERAYLPFISYSSHNSPRWTSDRQALQSLNIPPTHRILVPMPIQEFRSFFDDLADAMRNYLASLEE